MYYIRMRALRSLGGTYHKEALAGMESSGYCESCPRSQMILIFRPQIILALSRRVSYFSSSLTCLYLFLNRVLKLIIHLVPDPEAPAQLQDFEGLTALYQSRLQVVKSSGVDKFAKLREKVLSLHSQMKMIEIRAGLRAS